MNRTFYIGLAAALAAGAAWAGRVAWRAYKDVVTLQVRNMPLADVISRIERQTWERIVADSRLDTLVTLNVDNMPLADVLDRIAEQSGAFMTTLHAVHESRTALDKLLASLRNGEIANAAGWTNLAPSLADFNDVPGPRMMNFDSSPAGKGRGGRQMLTVDRKVVVRQGAEGAGQAVSGSPAPFIRLRGAGPGVDGSVQEESIVPERIVMEAKLESRMKTAEPLAPTRKAAQAAAREVQGRCTTLYALRKSAIGALGADTMRRFRSEFANSESTTPGTNHVRQGLPSLEAVERDARRADLSRFLNLTPEQRARRARERQEQGFSPP